MDAAATLENVSVAYGTEWALSQVSAEFPSGAVGLLGPNGAGKSTMLKALLGLIKPSTGTMRVLGLDVAAAAIEIRARIGYLPENDAYIPGMTAVSFVAYCGELSGLVAADAMQRAHEVLYYVGLGEARYRTVETYSTGMKQRIKLGAGARARSRFAAARRAHQRHGPERARGDAGAGARPRAQQEHQPHPVVAHDAGRRGGLRFGGRDESRQVVMVGPIATLKGPPGRLFEVRIKGNRPAFVDKLRSRSFECREMDGDLLRVLLPAEAGASELFASAASVGAQVRHLKPSLPTLEDVFARAVGETEGRV